MNSGIRYSEQLASLKDVLDHLYACNESHTPKLSERVDLSAYAEKIVANTSVFEAWQSGRLIGLVAVYFNRVPNAYITNVSVIPECMGMGIANKLMEKCVTYARQNEFKTIELEVINGNTAAVKLYKKFGFDIVETTESSMLLELYIEEKS